MYQQISRVVTAREHGLFVSLLGLRNLHAFAGWLCSPDLH